MKEQLEKRLRELEAEYEKGQEHLKKLEMETNNVRSSILRISGAIQVLKEELQIADSSTDSASDGEKG